MHISHILFYTSHRLRQHPFRFLIKGKRYNWFTGTDAGEDEMCQRAWPGPVWDVGASVGKYTPMMAEANPSRTVYAFEPNLNSLYYLGYRTCQYSNVVIVPGALTIDGQPLKTSYDPNFHKPPTGPYGLSFSVAEMVAKFGRPAFIKLDVEGLEYDMLETCGELLRYSALIVEWHDFDHLQKPRTTRPKLPFWQVTEVSPHHSQLLPREPAPAGK
jgi:FkbM family methyltransferase